MVGNVKSLLTEYWQVVSSWLDVDGWTSAKAEVQLSWKWRSLCKAGNWATHPLTVGGYEIATLSLGGSDTPNFFYFYSFANNLLSQY